MTAPVIALDPEGFSLSGSSQKREDDAGNDF